jgi:hypothetical protein
MSSFYLTVERSCSLLFLAFPWCLITLPISVVGPTAYTPGLKSVKVELQSSDISDSAESTAPPSRAAAFDPNSLHHLSPNHVSPFDLDSLSPGTTTSYSSSDSHDRTGWRDDSSTRSRQSAMEENRRRRDALFKKGKERVFPVDALFEE